MSRGPASPRRAAQSHCRTSFPREGLKLTAQDSNLEPLGPEPSVLPIRPAVIKSRGERIRTSDLLLPKQAHYQAVLHPEDARLSEPSTHPLSGALRISQHGGATSSEELGNGDDTRSRTGDFLICNQMPYQLGYAVVEVAMGGLEPPTHWVWARCSATELHREGMVEMAGFEPAASSPPD